MDVAWRADLLPQSTALLAVDVLTRTPGDGVPSGFQEARINGSSDASVPAQFLVEQHLERRDCIVKLLLPAVGGYLIQSDFLHRRLVDCSHVVKIQTFISLDRHFEGISIDACNMLDIADVLAHAVGAVVVSCTSSAWPETHMAQVNQELTRRFSFAWYSAKQSPKRCLAVIRPGPPSNQLSLSKLQDLATTAASLNILLVMFDDPCHGLAGAEWTHLRHDFVPMDMTLTDDMPQRIAAAVAAYPKPVDGIMAMYEPLLAVVAHAATLLGLSTSSPESVATARDKYKTRQFDPSLFCHRLQSLADLDDFLARYSTVAPLALPLIVKPANGWASEGVCKVSCAQELRDAVMRIWQPTFSDKYGRDSQSVVLVEPYVDGPEVDANLVLVNGEIVFFEVNDDFPSPGDSDGQGFVEVLNAMPSALPASELSALRHKAHDTVLAMGFTTGVFHVEARIHNSTFAFAPDQDSNSNSSVIIDLAAKPQLTNTNKDAAAPTVFILEVNPRPPGMRTSTAAAHTYGVSYRSLALLHALADHDRLRALALPFRGGPQYHMQILFLAAAKGGVYNSGDICAAVFDYEPSLRDHVVQCTSFLRNGQDVPHPRQGRTSGMAYFLVVSRASRREARCVSERIQRLVRRLTGGF